MKNLIILTIIFFTACVLDSINITQLVNATGEDIKVKVYYDKVLLDNQRVNSYKRFLEIKSERGQSFLTLVDADSISVNYLVPKNATLVLDKGNGPEPDFAQIKYIIIQSGGRSNRYGPSEISDAIKRKGHGLWEWKIGK